MTSPPFRLLTIRVPCVHCDRLFRVPDSTWLTRPRPACDDCMEIDTINDRVDDEGWAV